MPETMDSENRKLLSDDNTEEMYIVGIGASAGGLDALNRFFANIPDQPGMAFVVVQHLSPDHESHMVSLLSKKTGMEVVQVEDGLQVEGDRVYLIPPRQNLTIINKKLFLQEPQEKNKRYLNLPIDIFFKSLAEDRGKKAIGVILSGTGSDGARGIRAIKEQNGMVMVQEEDSAKFDGMPSNSIATGIVDYVLPPEKMGERLMNYIRHPYLNNQNQSIVEQPTQQNEDFLTRILSLIRDKTGINFFQYKESSVFRRIERRMIINQIEKIEYYYSFLQKSELELNTLSRELLIGVTNFFRDSEAFSLIKKQVIPELVEQKGNNSEIRLWVAGCSTGEEVYSLAILFMEYLEELRGNYKVKIFATDIQEDLLRKASMGQYPGSIVGDVSLKRLRRFFVKEGNMYKVNKNLREMVIFSRHDLISDPPFHKIDLISCRNLLIYLKAGIQQKIISKFRFSLNNHGYLFLGSSESLGDMFNNFTQVSTKWNIFRCKKCGNKLNDISRDGISNVDLEQNSRKQLAISGAADFKKTRKSRMEEKINLALIQNQLSDTVVIDENQQLVHLVGDVNEYFNFPVNKVSLDIIDMCPRGLDQALSIAINKVKRDQEQIVYKGVEFKKDGQTRMVDIFLTPLPSEDLERDLISIRFIQNTILDQRSDEQENQVIEYNEEEHTQQRIRDLEQELDYTRENLQATIEELETSNEELQASNEELMASNQQLQSTNEELESVNEELLTVNAEHQQKIEELSRLNNDMDNLLESTNIGTIFLNEDLCIRKFTPVVQRIINIRARDQGRPLQDISSNIDYDNLVEDTRRVLNRGNFIEEQIQTDNDNWYLMKIMPYRTRENQTDGIVITFIDVNKLHESNRQLQKFSYAVEKSPFIVVITDKEGNITYVNQAFCGVTGYREDEVVGKNTRILKSGQTDPEVYEDLWKQILAGERWQGVFINKNSRGELYREQAFIFPLLDRDQKTTHFIKFSVLPEQIDQ